MTGNEGIKLDDTVVQGKGNIVSNMDKEKVMLSITNGKYYNLGEIGGVIWDLIEQPITVTRLIAALVSEYDVAEDDCEKQVISFLEDLLREGLIYSGEKTIP